MSTHTRSPSSIKDNIFLLERKAWVEFTIGRYKDRVLCDILPMDGCHLLLVRPWTFDNQDIHDGAKNAYSFKKDGVTFKIQSFLEERELNTSSPSVLMVDEKELLKTLEEGDGVGFALFLKP